MSKKVLIIDDDPHIREVVRFALQKAQIAVLEAQDGMAGLKVFKTELPDLIILDVSMPEMDGLTFCKQVRKESEVPILFLSSMDDEVDKVIGFEIGGDDYVTKPFSPRELVARVKAIFKRVDGKKDHGNKSSVKYGLVEIDVESHKVIFDGGEVSLTATERSILKTLLSRPDRVYSRDDLMNYAYDNINVSDKTIDSHIKNIRKKFSDLGCDSIINTVHSIGFKAGGCN